MIAKVLRLPKEVWEDLEKEADKIGISVSAYIRLILSERKK